jgi:glycine/D-amino acid oxidase-like deaminating enzyme
MNVGNEASQSYWMAGAPVLDVPKLTTAEHCDVVVIGSGIAGLSVAYELSRLGRAVVVIDRGGIGKGMTARTTAHLSSALDHFYSELIRVRGEAEARLYHESQVAAINRIEAICRDENINCDFHRLDGYLIPTDEGPIADLRTNMKRAGR